MSISAVCKVCKETFVVLDKRQTSRCGKEHFKACDQCGTEFLITPNMLPTARFCSKACFGLSCRNTTVRLCLICNKEVKRVAARTCSTPCSTKLRNQTVQAQEKICGACGKPFNGLSTKKICDREHFSICEICGERFIGNPYAFRRTCSNLCNGKLINNEESNLKRRETSRKNWGTDFPFQSEEIKDRMMKTSIERYGTTHPMQSDEIQERSRISCEEKFGVPYSFQSEEVRAKSKLTNLDRYGFENPAQNEEVKAKVRNTIHEKFKGGVIPHPRISSINKNFAAMLGEAGFTNIEFEVPFGSSYSADLSLKNEKGVEILIDLHPTVSHNTEISLYCKISGCEIPCEIHKAVAPDYHFKRAKKALSENRALIQWYDWDDQNALVDFLNNRLSGSFRKYSARKLSLKVITAKAANEFLTLHHIQGGMRGQSYCFGLYASEELLAVATFGKARFKSKAEWEFLRYAVKGGVIINGGPGRLFSAFVEVVSPKTVVSYVDFNHTTRSSVFLVSLGFVEGALTGPAVVWHRVTDGKRVRETSLLAIGADRLLGTSYGRPEECGLVNRDIMLLEGFLPVATAGNRVFLWKS